MAQGPIDAQTMQALNNLSRDASALANVINNLARSVGTLGSQQTAMFNTMARNASLFSNEIKKASDVIHDADIEEAYEKERMVLQKRISDQSAITTSEFQIHKQRLTQQASDLHQSKEHAKRRLRDLEKLRKTQADRDGELAAASAAVELAKTKYTNSLVSLSSAEREQLKQQLDQAEQHRRQVEQTHKDQDEQFKELTETVKELDRAINWTTKEIKSSSTAWKEAGDNAKNVIKDGFATVFNKITGALTVGAAVNSLLEDIKVSIDRSINAIGVIGTYDIASLGLSPAELGEMSGEFRRAMISVGGLSNSVDIMQKAVDSEELTKTIADRGERAKFALEQMQMSMESGITTRARADRQVEKSAKVYASIAAKTGMTGKEFSDNLRNIMEDEAVITQMRMAATEAEREAILDSTRAIYADNRARGISEEQTRAMIKRQAQMDTEGPLARMKKGAQLQMVGQMLGVAGAGELMQLSMKGIRKTPEEKQREMRIKGEIEQRRMESVGGMDPLSFIMEQTTEQMPALQELKEFNVTLNKGMEAQTKLMEQDAKRQVSWFGEVKEMTLEANDKLRIIADQVTKNPYAQALLGAMTTILTPVIWYNALQLKANTKALLAWVTKKTGGELTSTFPDGPGGGNKKKSKGIPKGVKGGLYGLAGGMLLDYAAEAATSSGNKKTGAGLNIASSTLTGAGTGSLIGMVLGGLLGSVIPGAGTAAGAALGSQAGGWLGGLYGAGTGVAENWGTIYPKDEKINQQNQASVKPSSVTPIASERGKVVDTNSVASTAKITDANKTAVDKKISETTSTSADKATNLEKINEDGYTSTKLSLEQQIKKLDESNNYLKVVADSVPTLVDLASRQLAVMTMTDKQKEQQYERMKKIATPQQAAPTFNYI
jgi:hypothetical protein